MNSPKPETSRATLSCAALSPVAAPSLASPEMYCPSVRPGTKPFVSPTRPCRARRRQAGALPKHLEQAIVVQSEIVRVDAIEVLLDGAACQLHCPVGEFAHDFLAAARILAGGEGA